jgi:integrase
MNLPIARVVSPGHIQEIRGRDGQTTGWRAVVVHPTELTKSGGARRLSRLFSIGRGLSSTKARAAARDWLDQTRMQLRTGHAVTISTKTHVNVSAVADAWLKSIEIEGENRRGKLREGTLDYYRRNVRNFIHEPPSGVIDIGLIRVALLTPPVIGRWVEECIAAVSRDAAKRALTILKALLRYAVSQNWVAANASTEVKLGTNRDDDGRIEIVLQREHVQAILKTAKDLMEKGWSEVSPSTGAQRKAAANRKRAWAKWYPLIHLAFYSGARSGEVLAARWFDFNYDLGTFKVERTVSFKGRIAPPKTVRGNRTLAMDSATMALIKARFDLLAPKNRFGYVFGTASGKPDNRSNLRRAWDSLLRLANENLNEDLPPLVLDGGGSITSPYHSRHYHASELLLAGVSLQDVSERLGHADTVVTQRHYAHLLGDRAAASREAVSKFSAALGGR